MKVKIEMKDSTDLPVYSALRDWAKIAAGSSGASGSGFPVWGRTVSSASENSLSDLAFPMIRRVMATTIGSDLVSVQPMSGPSGQIFYGDYIYGSPYPYEVTELDVEKVKKIFRGEDVQVGDTVDKWPDDCGEILIRDGMIVATALTKTK